MDIQVASNFERLIFDACSCNSEKIIKLMNDLNERGEFKLEKNELEKINKNFCSGSLSEEETKSVIKEVYKNQKILIDPHTAVAIGVVNKISSGRKYCHSGYCASFEIFRYSYEGNRYKI